MKVWFILFMSLAFSSLVFAGDKGASAAGDPHAGLGGGCESKAKIARLKQLFGEDFLRQHPQAKFSTLDEAEPADKGVSKKVLEEFI